MPVYTYRCQSCSAMFERTQMFSDKSLTRCPECHMSTVRRIPQLPAVIFKGSGWYSIDHRSLTNQKTGELHKTDDKTRKALNEESEN